MIPLPRSRRRTPPRRQPVKVPRARLCLEELESRLAPDTKTLGGLDFIATNTFANNAGTLSVTGSVTVQRVGEDVDILQFGNGVSFVEGNAGGDFTANGSVNAVLGGKTLTLLNAAQPHAFKTGDLLGAGDVVAAGETTGVGLKVAGVNFAPTSMKIVGAQDLPMVQMPGAVSFSQLGGVGFDTPGSSLVQVDTAGNVNFSTDVDIDIGQKNFAKDLGGKTLNVQVDNVHVTYASALKEFAFTGAGNFTFSPYITSPINIKLGSPAADGVGETRGIVVTDGTLTRFDLKVENTGSNTISVKGLKFTPSFVHVLYSETKDASNRTNSTLAFAGAATFAFADAQKAKGLPTLTVKLGDDTSADNYGLVITNGELSKLQSTVNMAEFSLGSSVKLKEFALGLTYDKPQDTFGIAGAAKLEVSSSTIEVGAAVTIKDGALTHLELEVAADKKFTFKNIEFAPKSLHFVYDKSGSDTTFKLSGAASLGFTIAGEKQLIDVSLGDATHDGLVIKNGSLESFYAKISADFSVKRLKISAKDVTIEYDNAAEQFLLDGSIEVSLDMGSSSARLKATFGDGGTHHGVVIHNGSLQSLYIVVSGGFNLFGLSVQSDGLKIQYVSAQNRLELSGGASIELSKAFKFGANIREGGLVIDTATGELSIDTGANGLSIAGSIDIGGFIGADVDIRYKKTASGSFDLAVAAQVHLPQGMTVGGNLEIKDGNLSAIGLFFDAGAGSGIPIGNTGVELVYIAGSIKNLDNIPELEVSGNLGIRFGKAIRIGSTNYSLFEARGTVTIDADHINLKADVTLVGGFLGRGSGEIDINWSTGVYQIIVSHIGLYDDTLNFSGSMIFNNQGHITISATADLRIPRSIPFIGGTRLAGGGFYLQIRPDMEFDQNFAAAWVDVSILGFNKTVGFKIDFNFDVSFLNAPYKPPVDAGAVAGTQYSYVFTPPAEPGVDYYAVVVSSARFTEGSFAGTAAAGDFIEVKSAKPTKLYSFVSQPGHTTVSPGTKPEEVYVLIKPSDVQGPVTIVVHSATDYGANAPKFGNTTQYLAPAAQPVTAFIPTNQLGVSLNAGTFEFSGQIFGSPTLVGQTVVNAYVEDVTGTNRGGTLVRSFKVDGTAPRATAFDGLTVNNLQIFKDDVIRLDANYLGGGQRTGFYKAVQNLGTIDINHTNYNLTANWERVFLVRDAATGNYVLNYRWTDFPDLASNPYFPESKYTTSNGTVTIKQFEVVRTDILWPGPGDANAVYRYVGTDASRNLATQNYADTNLWLRVGPPKYRFYVSIDNKANDVVYSNYTNAIKPPNPAPIIVSTSNTFVSGPFTPGGTLPGAVDVGNSTGDRLRILNTDINLDFDYTVSVDQGGTLRSNGGDLGTAFSGVTTKSFASQNTFHASATLGNLFFDPDATFTGKSTITITATTRTASGKAYTVSRKLEVFAPHSHLVVKQDVDKQYPNEGQEVLITVRVSNPTGPGVVGATNVNVNTTIPAGFSFVDAQSAVGAYDAQTGVWTLPSLAAGAEQLLTLRAKVNAGSVRTQQIVGALAKGDQLNFPVEDAGSNLTMVVIAGGQGQLDPAQTLLDGAVWDQFNPIHEYPAQAIRYLASAAGSGGPYSFRVVSGNLPAGLTMSPDGVITGRPETPGTFTFRVAGADRLGVPAVAPRDYTIRIAAGSAPQGFFFNKISPLRVGNFGLGYRFLIGVNDENDPSQTASTYSVASGSLPPGLTLDANSGFLNGVPTTSGFYSFTIRRTYTVANSFSGPQSYQDSILVTRPLPGLNAPPELVEFLFNGVPQGVSVNPTGVKLGVGFDPANPFTGSFFVTKGELPRGITLSRDGVISGTPLDGSYDPADDYHFTLQAVDNQGLAASLNITMFVEPGQILIEQSSLANGNVGQQYSQGITWIGGSGEGDLDEEFTQLSVVDPGNLPPGLTLDQHGLLAGFPTTAGNYTFQVQAVNSDLLLDLESEDTNIIEVTPAGGHLPGAATGQFYQQEITAANTVGNTDGVTGHFFFIEQNYHLPAGLELMPDPTNPSKALLQGMPTEAGHFRFGVFIEDNIGRSAFQEFSLVVARTFTVTIGVPTTPITFGVDNLVPAVKGAAYSRTLTASGGSGFVFTSADPLPAGLSLSAAGVLSGTPTFAGRYVFTINVADSAGSTASQRYTLDVSSYAVAAASNSVSFANAATPYLTPSAYSISAGALPAGLSISTTGAITGTPTTPGIYQFTLHFKGKTATSAPLLDVHRPITMVVNPGVTVTTDTLAGAAMGTAYNQSLAAAGGTGQGFTFAVTTGALPTGLTLSAAGVLAGTPTKAGSFTFTVTATDSAGVKGARAYTVAVLAGFAVNTSALSTTGILGIAYSAAVTASGGSGAGYTFDVSSGALPAGLTLSTAGILSGTPTTVGASTFQVTATDSAGKQTTSAPFTLNVVTTPATPVLFSGGTLTVFGTAGNDVIELAPQGAKLQVKLNGVSVGNGETLASIQLIQIAGQAGADTITVTNLPKPLSIVGGADSDSFVLNAPAIANIIRLGASTIDVNGKTVTLGEIENITINAQTAKDTLFIDAIPSLAVTFDGGLASDSVIGLPAVANNFIVNAVNGATLNGTITLKNTENLTGGNLDDTFAFQAGKTLAGKIDALAGADTLDYSLYIAPVSFNPQAKKSTGNAGIAGFESFLGGASPADTLLGPSLDNTWNLTGVNAGNVAGVNFAGIENLTGGGKIDTFVFTPAGSVTGAISGGAGNDQLDYSAAAGPITVNLTTGAVTGAGSTNLLESVKGSPSTADVLIGAAAANTWKLTGANTGDINGKVKLAFAAIENLTGGPLADTFNFTLAGSVAGAIDGAAGKDSLSYASFATIPIAVNLQTRTANAIGGFANIESIAAGAASGTLTGADQNNTWTVTSKDNGAVSGFSFKKIKNLVGGNQNDMFLLSANVGVTGQIDGGAGRDTLSYAAYALAITVDLAAGTSTNIISGVTGIENVYGGLGKDAIKGDAGDNLLLGNAGDDNLQGGAGNDTLLGGAGKDTLGGQEDRDLLVGGSLADRLEAGAGEDILVGALFTFHNEKTGALDLASLQAVFAEWTRTDADYLVRIDHLLNGGGLNNDVRLLPTIFTNDKAIDKLFGQDNLDWLLPHANDEISDWLAAEETKTSLV